MIAARDHVFVGVTVACEAPGWHLEIRFIVQDRALERFEVVTGDPGIVGLDVPVMDAGAGILGHAYFFASSRVVERGTDFRVDLRFLKSVLVPENTRLSVGLLDVDLMSPAGLMALMRRAANNSTA